MPAGILLAKAAPSNPEWARERRGERREGGKEGGRGRGITGLLEGDEDSKYLLACLVHHQSQNLEKGRHLRVWEWVDAELLDHEKMALQTAVE